MRWRKLGPVYAPDASQDWAVSHAFCPTSLALDSERIRVYLAFRDRDQVGRAGYVDVAAEDPTRVLAVSETPVLDVGEPGMFDDSGVTPLSVCRDGDSIRLYYAGWQLGVQVRYFLFLGLAISEDGGESFQRASRVPVLERSDAEPMNRTGAHVQPFEGGWRMWYAGGDRWVETEGKRVPTYPLRYLESADGIEWGPSGELALDIDPETELGLARPFVVEAEEGLRMWYSKRLLDGSYRIGYAESADGHEWERRDDEAGIEVGESGWDSEMIGLSCVQPTEHGTYLFYNGNDFGATGFGVAVDEGE